ncbi:hypothetical protein CC80DRAFT_588696, partial [Byssothecium circinans]
MAEEQPSLRSKKSKRSLRSLKSLHSSKQGVMNTFLRTNRSPTPKIPPHLQIQPPSTLGLFPNATAGAFIPSPSPHRIAVELSNFPPNFVKADIVHLFKDFHILEEFALPKTTRFAYPFRATIYLGCPEQARRAVMMLDGTVCGGRKISVTLKESEVRKRAQEIDHLADGLKFAIINTARTYFPHLRPAILEVREFAKDNENYAFLQARHPVTLTESTLEEHIMHSQNMAAWVFVAGGMAELDMEKNKETYDVRLEALKDLALELEKQGVMRSAWTKWDGRLVLDQSVQPVEQKEEVVRAPTPFERVFGIGKVKSQPSRGPSRAA